MSSIGGEVGGKVGNSQNPFFQSPGGVTPEQQSLAQYDYGQNLLQGQQQYAGSDQGGGAGMSTMATQTAGGANMGQALDLSRMSDVDQTAMFGASEVGNNIQSTNQTNAINEISSLGKLAAGAKGSS